MADCAREACSFYAAAQRLFSPEQLGQICCNCIANGGWQPAEPQGNDELDVIVGSCGATRDPDPNMDAIANGETE